METLRYSNIVEANKTDWQQTIIQAVDAVQRAQKTYSGAFFNVFTNGFVDRQIETTENEIAADPLANVTITAAGAYFGTENVINGSRVDASVKSFNEQAQLLDDNWVTQPNKMKLAPGIGYTVASPIYSRLIQRGITNPNASLNYTAPGGTNTIREGIARIMGAQIDPEKQYFSPNEVFLTEGATEAIDLVMEAQRMINPNSLVIFLGLSYYTGSFSAEQKGLKIDRLVTNPIQNTGETKFLPTAIEIAASLPPNAKLLVLTLPNNPNGETYSEQELTNILSLAKERNMIVLIDTLFESLTFEENAQGSTKLLQIANSINALDRIVVVDGLSKSRNFPGERIGFLATTNTDMVEALNKITLARRCNPRLTLEPLVLFEGLARTVKMIQKSSPRSSLRSIIQKVLASNSYFEKEDFTSLYRQWDAWNTQTLEFYKGNLEIVRAVLSPSLIGWSPDTAAYNTFVRPKGIPLGTNNMDFAAKLMFAAATYTQVGPCFGMSQKVWDQNLGVWMRITYACSRNDLIEGLKRLIIFSTLYAEKDLGNRTKYPVLNVSYDKQI